MNKSNSKGENPTDPRDETLNPQHEIIARRLIQNILYDNGMVNRWEPESQKSYPKSHVRKISIVAGIFFDSHPELLTDDDLSNICCGEETENESKYGVYPEYKALNDSLNNYFNR